MTTTSQINFCKGMVFDKSFHKTRPISTVENVDDAVKLVNEKGNLFEVLHGRQITKVYFDFDKTIEKYDEKQITAENDNNIYAIVEYFFEGNITKDDVAIAQRHRWLNDTEFKISFRYYLPNFSAYYPDIKNRIVKCGLENLFDTSVYKDSEQLLGCINNYKNKGDTIALTPVTNHIIEDFIVQIVPSYSHFLPLPVSEHKINTLSNKNPTESIDFNILRDVVMNLDKSRSNFYPLWTEVVWGIYNTEKDETKRDDLIHEFSKLSKKYNKNKVNGFIQKDCKDKEKGKGIGFGTLMMYLEEDNEDVCKVIKAKMSKKVQLNGYSFVDVEENTVDLLDGQKRDYNTIKEIFEKNNFKVCDKRVLYVEAKKVNGELEIKDRTRAEAQEAFENLHYYSDDLPKVKNGKDNFFLKWIKDPTIRSYDKMDFIPPPAKVSAKTFNLWKGFRAEKIDLQITKEERKELLEPIYKHLSIICNNHSQSAKYVKKWIAQFLQQCSYKIGIALCFQSQEGSGKGTLFCDFLGKLIIGQEYYWESSDCVSDLFSKHSNAFYRRLLVNIDEPTAFDLRQNADRFKSLITSSTQRLEGKGRDIKQVTTCERYVITTNNEDVLKLSSNDRRFVVIECSDELLNNAEYFTKLHDYIQRPDVQRAFYDDMMEEDINNFDWKRERPMTDAYIRNLDSCVQPHVRFMAGEVRWCNNCHVNEYQIKATALFERFNKILAQCRSKYVCEYGTFAKLVKKMAGVNVVPHKNSLYFNIDIEQLKEHLIKKEKFDFGTYQFYDVDEEN